MGLAEQTVIERQRSVRTLA